MTRTHPQNLTARPAMLIFSLTLLVASAGRSVLIDDFSNAQGPTASPGTPASVTSGAMLGGERDLAVERTAGAGTVSAEAAGGELAFLAPAGTTGTALLSWDGGDADPRTLETTGLPAAIDLTEDGTSGGLRLVVESATAGTQVTVTLYQDADRVSRAARVLPAIASTTAVHFSFAEMVAIPGAVGPADPAMIRALTLRLSGGDTDTPPTARLSRFETVAPQVTAAKVDLDSGGAPIAAPGARPGDEIRYRITLGNQGGGAEGVSLEDLVENDPNLSGVGSFRSTPLARRDHYRTLTGQILDSAAAVEPSLLVNDVDPDGDAVVAVAAIAAPTTQGGTVDIGADGHFVYTPPPGFHGVDSFAYGLESTAGDPTSDSSGAPIGTVGTRVFVVVEKVTSLVAGGTLDYTEGDPPTAVDPALTLTDSDSPNLVGASAEISSGYAPGEDALSFADTGSITGSWNPATGTLTLAGTESVAGYQAALRSVAYANASADPSTTPRTVAWSATDGVDTSAPAASTIQVTAENDPPRVTGGAFSVAESASVGAVVGSVAVTDDDASQSHAFALVAGNDDGAFAIDPTSGRITVAAGLDFESRSAYALTVEVTDDGSTPLSDTASVTVAVTDVNEAPAVEAVTFGLDSDRLAVGTRVGTVTAVDPDIGQAHTLAITAGDSGGAFALDPATGLLTIADPTAVDYAVSPSFSLTVEAADNGLPALVGSGTVTVDVLGDKEVEWRNIQTNSNKDPTTEDLAVTSILWDDNTVWWTHPSDLVPVMFDSRCEGSLEIGDRAYTVTVVLKQPVHFTRCNLYYSNHCGLGQEEIYRLPSVLTARASRTEDNPLWDPVDEAWIRAESAHCDSLDDDCVVVTIDFDFAEKMQVIRAEGQIPADLCPAASLSQQFLEIRCAYDPNR